MIGEVVSGALPPSMLHMWGLPKLGVPHWCREYKGILLLGGDSIRGPVFRKPCFATQMNLHWL